MVRKIFRKQIAPSWCGCYEQTYDPLLAELPCVFKCREDNRCQSFNWVISLLTCKFDNRTKEARPEDFIPNPDRCYYRRDLERGEPA